MLSARFRLLELLEVVVEQVVRRNLERELLVLLPLLYLLQVGLDLWRGFSLVVLRHSVEERLLACVRNGVVLRLLGAGCVVERRHREVGVTARVLEVYVLNLVYVEVGVEVGLRVHVPPERGAIPRNVVHLAPEVLLIGADFRVVVRGGLVLYVVTIDPVVGAIHTVDVAVGHLGPIFKVRNEWDEAVGKWSLRIVEALIVVLGGAAVDLAVREPYCYVADLHGHVVERVLDAL